MSQKIVIPPEFISWEDWAAAVVLHSAPSNIPPPYEEENWDRWAVDLFQHPPYNVLTPFTSPPSKYTTWQEWARHFNSLVIDVLP